MHNTVVST